MKTLLAFSIGTVIILLIGYVQYLNTKHIAKDIQKDIEDFAKKRGGP